MPYRTANGWTPDLNLAELRSINLCSFFHSLSLSLSRVVFSQLSVYQLVAIKTSITGADICWKE